MAKILRFNGDRHRQTQEALPWYVMDKLDAGERASVEIHLAHCAACRRDLEIEQELAGEVARLSLDADAGWLAVQRRIREPANSPKKLPQALADLLFRPTRLGWLLAGQVLVLIAAGAVYSALPLRAPAEYHALGAQPAYLPGNVIAIFRPDISEERFRTALLANRARLVDGPTASGAYILRVPEGQRAEILQNLRANRDVTLAQPIDAERVQ